MAALKRVIIHTDGGCEGNPGPGGRAAVLECGPHQEEISGGEPATTNNRMELQAAIAALTCLRARCEVELFTEVCSAGDEFGLVARTNSLGEHYRFVIGCDGKARISRALEAGSRALTLWTASPAIIPGAPARNRLGVLADGLDLTLFVNGTAVVAARDSALTEGTFGLMARAGPAGQVAASFDDLVVRTLSDHDGAMERIEDRSPHAFADVHE